MWQKNLQGNFWVNLKYCTFQELCVDTHEEISNSLIYLKNLTTITCLISILTDGIVKTLAQCYNLKKINFSIDFMSLTKKGVIWFAGFDNLESLTFTCRIKSDTKINISSVLNAITLSNKNIKELNVIDCDIGSSGLNYISMQENLTVLKLSITYKFIKLLMNAINKNLPNLQEIEIDSETMLNYPFLKKINDKKVKRDDQNILKIYVDEWIWNDTQRYHREFSMLSILKRQN